MMTNNYEFLPLTKEIQDKYSKKFDCGNTVISNFLKSYEALDEAIGKTFVMIKSECQIVGYYNISTGHIESNDIRLGGSIYINYLAVDKDYQKIKLNDDYYFSDMLFANCLKHIEELRKSVGFAFVTLASTEEGYYLYERNGFCPLEDDMRVAKNSGELSCTPMYFPIDYE